MYRRLYGFAQLIPLYTVIFAGALYVYIIAKWLGPTLFGSWEPVSLATLFHFSIADIYFVVKMLAELITVSIISRYVEIVIQNQGRLPRFINDWFVNKIVDEHINSTK